MTKCSLFRAQSTCHWGDNIALFCQFWQQDPFVELSRLHILQIRPHCNGVIASIPLASLLAFCLRLFLCSPGAIALIALALLSLFCWRCCHRCTGIDTVVALVSSPVLLWRCCQHRAGILTGVPLASTTLLCWDLHHYFTGIVAIAALSPSLRWHRRLCHTRIAASIMLASLPAFRWHCHPCCTGIYAIIFAGAVAVVVLSPLLRWRCHPRCIATVVALALLPLLHPRHRNFAGVPLALSPSLLGCIFLFLCKIFYFCEIQESVVFLRNPQDLKIPAGKQKKCCCFWGKTVLFLAAEYRNISQESSFTVLGVGINMFLKGSTLIHYNDCIVEEDANGISSWSSCRTNYSA